MTDENVQAAVEVMSGPPKKEAQELVGFLKTGAFSIHPEGIKG